jgi:lysophospholipase L1-like esterase
VEVINAGVSGWTLQNQLLRIEADILPLQPDLVITYHGYNGFRFLFPELPPMVVERAPADIERPSRVLARIETWLHLRRFLRRYDAARELVGSVPEVDLETSAYADLYRRLAALLAAHGVRLAVATFNMAVNADSPEDVVRFYELGFPDVRLRMLANQLHTRLIREIPLGPGVVTIDTAEGLNGVYDDMYVDVVHFTQKGRDRLAGNILQGISPILTQDLQLRCRTRHSQARD